MGGYHHIAQVISADLGRVGQLHPGASVHFERVTLAHARTLDTDFRRRWAVRLNQVLVHVRDGAKGLPPN
jgi:allophanate hydrolase subunit 2